MKNFVQPGRMLTLTAPSGGVASGDGVMVGSVFGVAAFDAAEGAEVEVATEGVFELKKTTGAAWTVGLPIFWNDTTKKAATSGDLQIGVAVAAAGSSAAVGLVKLDPIPAVPAAAIADLAGGADLAAVIAKVNVTAVLPNLIARGFPRPDPDTGNFDLHAIDRWCDTRHAHLFGGSPATLGARDASTVASERIAAMRAGGRNG
jgi:predicted RecA/RadA family phage recombinase